MIEMNKVGLVLEGGGMRGLYTGGVLDFFLDKGLLFQDIIGVSAGACNAVSYISRQRGRNFKVNTDYVGDKRYLSFEGMIKRGSIFGMDFLFEEIPDKLVPFDYETYYSSNMHLTIVVTNCETGKPEYLDGGHKSLVNRYLRASSSIPMFAPIVEIEGKKYLDGGTADSIPIQFSKERGNTKQIVVVTRNEGYVKKPEPFKWLYSRQYKGYPKLIETIQNRHHMYNNTLKTLSEWEASGEALVIRPSKPITIGRFEKDIEKLRELYNNGYEDAARLYEQIKSFCSDCDNVVVSK
jgi:predicted patatin/cPLA2 family phospholipase